MEYCRQNMEICVKDNELENVAASSGCYGNLIRNMAVMAAAIQCWNQLQSEIGIMPCAANALLNEEGRLSARQISTVRSTALLVEAAHAMTPEAFSQTGPSNHP